MTFDDAGERLDMMLTCLRCHRRRRRPDTLGCGIRVKSQQCGDATVETFTDGWRGGEEIDPWTAARMRGSTCLGLSLVAGHSRG